MNDIKSQHRAFEEMRKPALARLQGKDAEVLAGNTGLDYDKNQQIFFLESLGEKVQILYPQYEITPKLNDWHHLLILHYIDMADGTPLSGQLMAFGKLPGGMVRKACEALGAEIFDSNADLSAVFHLFPFYPITLKLWFADEEIPGSGRLLLDRSAEHFLSVEDAVTAGFLVLEGLLKKYKELC